MSQLTKSEALLEESNEGKGIDSSSDESKSSSTALSDGSSPESFDFEKFPEKSGECVESVSSYSFLTVNENLPKDTTSNSIASNQTSQKSGLSGDVVERLNRRLTALGYGLLDNKNGNELTSSLGNKFLAVLGDVQQKSEISKGLLEESRSWKSREQALLANIR